ncbi:MAG TPA: tetratricopeptide repeat protein, partial [Thermoanaerobaculia bacterium]|nr:tetratricopeptide repeat protein [Thermoanaerobaculia bacterium]
MNTPRAVLLAAALVAAAQSGHAQDQLYPRIASLETSIAQGTATRAEQLELARLLVESGRYYEASRAAERVLLLDPNDAEAVSLRDEAKRKLSELTSQRVIEVESRANRSGATDQDRLALANAYFDAGSYATAAQIYGSVPAPLVTREIRLRHARALSWSGKMDDAERIYAAVRKESSTPELDVEYGQMLSWMGASRAALDVLRPAYAAAPTEESVTALANAYAWSGHREEAIRLLREHTAQHPAQVRASRLLRDLEASPELRLEQVERLIEREPFNLALRVERARLLVDAGRDSEALNTLAFVREHSSQRIEGVDELEQRAKAHREQERARIAEELSRIDTRELSNADQILSVAKAATAVGDYETATRLYQDYLRLRPNDSEARIAYARVLSWDQRYAAASREYQKLIEQHPDRADLRLEYAQILSWDSDFIDAVHMFSSLTDLSEHPRAHLYGDVPPRAHFNLGQIYRWYGW